MQVYLVGGAVRDQLLGRPIKDKDFVVVGTTVDAMLAAGFQQVGADFPVFLHPVTHEEYALARTERKQGHGYQGFKVHASSEVTLKEDLQRRDLTVNAMAIEVTSLTDDTPITDTVVDYYGGLEDMATKTLRHVSEAFSEDPLRVLRTARFYSRYYDLGFTIATQTLELMTQLVSSGELRHLSAERIWQESSRATMQDSPQVYWQQLFDIGALVDYFAPLQQAWRHTHIRETVQTALYFAGQMQLNLSQRWALLMASVDPTLFATINQQNAEQDNGLSHSKNAGKSYAATAKAVTDIIHTSDGVKVPKAQTQFASLFVQQAHKLAMINQLSAAETIDLLQACSAHKDPNKLSQLLVTSQLLQLAQQHRRTMLALNSFHAITMDSIDPQLKGADIGAALRQTRIEHLQAASSQTSL